MKILISNDDGVHAPGIRVLKEYLSEIAEVYVVAPLEERSTTGHTLTLDSPLRITQIEDRVWGCSGYPADCTLMGFGHLLKAQNIRPDLVVSGINRGANMGQDVYYSGTVAAAREAAFHGFPSIAVSSVLDFLPKPADRAFYETAAEFVCKVVKNGLHQHIGPLSLLNINVPNVPKEELLGVQVTRLGFRHYCEDIRERHDFRDRPYYWIGGVYKGFRELEGTDCHAVEEKYVSVCPLNLLGHASDTGDTWSRLINQVNW